MRTKYIDLLEQAGRIFLTMGDTFFRFCDFRVKKKRIPFYGKSRGPWSKRGREIIAAQVF